MKRSIIIFVLICGISIQANADVSVDSVLNRLLEVGLPVVQIETVDGGITAKSAQTVGIIVAGLNPGRDPESEKTTVPRALLQNHFGAVRLISSAMMNCGRFLTCEKIFPM